MEMGTVVLLLALGNCLVDAAEKVVALEFPVGKEVVKELVR